MRILYAFLRTQSHLLHILLPGARATAAGSGAVVLVPEKHMSADRDYDPLTCASTIAFVSTCGASVSISSCSKGQRIIGAWVSIPFALKMHP